MGKKRSDNGDESMSYPVKYSNVNIGDKTASVHVTISRANLTVTQADKQFCERQLKCRILARSTGGSEQVPLPGMDEDVSLKGIADVTGFSADGKTIKVGLTFMISEIDVPELAKFAKKEGMLFITEIGSIPEPPPKPKAKPKEETAEEPEPVEAE